MTRRAASMVLLLLAWGGVPGCSDNPSGPESCADQGTQLDGNVCLVLGGSGAFEPLAAVVEEEVQRTLAAVRARVAVTDLRIVFLADPSGIIPEIGIGGFNPGPNEVRIYVDPGGPDAEGIVRGELLRILSHETHHALRRRSVGYGNTLYRAAVTEGLADHFSLEVGAGGPAPWSVALSPETLDEWMPQVLAGTQSGYDHGAWFVGTSSSIPRWTGYAVGFELVNRYLEQHPGASAAGLVDESAETFRPESGP